MKNCFLSYPKYIWAMLFFMILFTNCVRCVSDPNNTLNQLFYLGADFKNNETTKQLNNFYFDQ